MFGAIKKNSWIQNSYTKPTHSQKKFPASPYKIRFIRKILNQPYTYLAEGSRMVAFVSDDEKFVIKLFKNPNGIKAQFEEWGINLGKVNWSPSPGNTLQSADILLQRTVESCELAFSKLQRETGLVYFHLGDIDLCGSRLNLEEESMDIGVTPFLIQKKVQIIDDRLRDCMERKDVSSAQHAIDQLLKLIIHIWRKGITEDTFNFQNNYGFDIYGRLILIDTGELYNDKKKILEQIKAQNILYKESFQELRNEYPILAEYLMREVERKFNESSILS